MSLLPCAPSRRLPRFFASLLLKGTASLALLMSASAIADDATPDNATGVAAETASPGHSYHGEAFNDGPRQAAYLMTGMGQVDFAATTSNELAKRFINQGIAQLHGFWYYEAERSFRQAAVLDRECAIAYWGMALANIENKARARDFIAKAVERKEQASRQEQLFIDAYAEFFREDEEGKKRENKELAQRLTHDLEAIIEEFPDSVEAKAFLAVQLWQNERSDLPIVSHVAVNALLQDVFDANPMHPAHHYRIHLWDGHKPAQALTSAALCGQSSPGIAHMWHMPGHIYSKLHRYNDACWQQEASARVDHAHMIRDRVMPDQIHNFAHNNEWLCRNLVKVGRVTDAISLAKNMQELPRHPKNNTLDQYGSTKYGRERLLLVLSRYRLWDTMVELADTVYLEPTDNEALQNERLRALGIAYALSGRSTEAAMARSELESRLSAITTKEQELQPPPATTPAATEATAATEPTIAPSSNDSGVASTQQDNSQQSVQATADAAPQATADAAPQATAETAPQADANAAEQASQQADEQAKQRKEELKKLKEARERLEKQIAAVSSAQFAASSMWSEALELWSKSDLDDELLKAEWLAESGKPTEALDLVSKEIERAPGEVLPHAILSWLKYRTQGATAARETFEELRLLASMAERDTPLLDRLKPLAAELGIEATWNIPYQAAADAGVRPDLDTLGPFRWQPALAPNFAVQSASGQRVTLTGLGRKPTLVIFYLGFGCLHCVEQLQAFSPRLPEFQERGIQVMAISSENLESLNKALTNFDKPLAIPLHSDPALASFKSYRCYDDFESQPLHGTFLIDPDGQVLWQDISYEPFMDVDFCLKESQRLLKLNGF